MDKWMILTIRGHKIAAIKAYRQGMVSPSLVVAKEVVEDYERMLKDNHEFMLEVNLVKAVLEAIDD